MRNETIAIHAGYEPDPTTKSVAVPIYQTVAYAFDSADHGAALFNLEAEGYRYSRIANPTTAVLEKRVAELEGGVGALAVATGQAALHFALVNLADGGGNIVSVPQLYGTTHTLLSHVLPRQGITARFADSDRPTRSSKLIDENTKAVFCETIGNPAGNVCDIEALAEGRASPRRPAGRRQHGRHPDPAQAVRLRRRHRGSFADQISRRPRHHARRRDRRQRPLSMDGACAAFSCLQRARRILSRPGLHQAIRRQRLYPARAQRLSAHHGIGAFAVQCLPAAAGHRDGGVARRTACRERPQSRGIPAHSDPRVAWVNYAGFSDSPYYALVQKYLNGHASSLFTFGIKGGLEAGKAFYDSLKLITRLVNIGDAKSLACHPASTTHRQMSAEEQRMAGVLPETIRLSIGIEHSRDIIEDIDQALAQACSRHPQLEAAE